MKKFLWQVEPDWTNGITETLEWKTDILQSYSGAEQRIARRLSPRRTFEFSILINGNERARFENKLAYVGGNSWYFPIFTDVTYLETNVDLNTTVLPCNTTGRDFVSLSLVGSEMCIRDRNQSALLEVVDVNENSITLINPLKLRFNAGACIYPVRLAVLTDVPKLTHYNDDLLSAQIRFRISEHNAFSNDISYLPIYRHFPVLTMYPDWSESLKGQYERFLIELDNGSSIPTRLDTAKLPFWVQEFRWFVTDRTEQMLLRKLFYYLTGSQKCIWVSTQISDFNVIAVNGQILDIENVGFYEIGLMPGRKDVVITLCNGDVLYRRIETVAAVSDEIERLLLNDSINVNTEDILSVSFLTLCRLDSDSVSWEHVTDADGLANITCSFRGIRDELESI